LLEDDVGSVREAAPVDGGVAVATSHASVDTLRYSKDGRTWSDLATIDPPDVPALSAVSLSDAGDGGIRAHWFAALQPETARSAAWVFSRGPLPSRAP
jgi:hypothetical protein